MRRGERGLVLERRASGSQVGLNYMIGLRRCERVNDAQNRIVSFDPRNLGRGVKDLHRQECQKGYWVLTLRMPARTLKVI